MTTLDTTSVNLRVATALGLKAILKEAGCLPYPIPDYCNSPAAAQLVIDEIERRGWWWRIEKVAPPEADRTASVYATGRRYKESTVTTPWHALCLAFLTAHYDTQEAGL